MEIVLGPVGVFRASLSDEEVEMSDEGLQELSRFTKNMWEV